MKPKQVKTGKIIDMVGKTIGLLVVIKRAPNQYVYVKQTLKSNSNVGM
jgi:hypothetical protein